MEKPAPLIKFENEDFNISSPLLALVPLGLPLIGGGHSIPAPLNETLLLEKLKTLADEFTVGEEFNEREKDALFAFLNAISTHFRKTWNQVPNCLRLYQEQYTPSRSILRLRRIAIEQLGRYL